MNTVLCPQFETPNYLMSKKSHEFTPKHVIPDGAMDAHTFIDAYGVKTIPKAYIISVDMIMNGKVQTVSSTHSRDDALRRIDGLMRNDVKFNLKFY